MTENNTGVLGIEYEEVSKIVNDSDTDWMRFIKDDSDGLTKTGQVLLQSAIESLMWPHFNYCSTIWNDGCCLIIDKLFKLQKRAARVITGDTYDVRSTQTLDSLN